MEVLQWRRFNEGVKIFLNLLSVVIKATSISFDGQFSSFLFYFDIIPAGAPVVAYYNEV